jgi:hypothetical protein
MNLSQDFSMISLDGNSEITSFAEKCQFDISGIDKVDLLKAFWEIKIDLFANDALKNFEYQNTDFFGEEEKSVFGFDYKKAEKAVQGFIDVFCEAEINLDFSCDSFVIVTNKDDVDLFKKLIEKIESGTYRSLSQWYVHFYGKNGFFHRKFQQEISEFEFIHKKSGSFIKEYKPKMFQTVKEIHPEEFDDFYGRGSFEGILERTIERLISEEDEFFGKTGWFKNILETMIGRYPNDE